MCYLSRSCAVPQPAGSTQCHTDTFLPRLAVHNESLRGSPRGKFPGRDPPWNSSIKASSLVIFGAPAQSAQSFSGIFHTVHASSMSQESKKFPLRSIFPVFCESHQHESPPVGTGARKLKPLPLAESRIEGRHLLGQVIQRTAALEIFWPNLTAVSALWASHLTDGPSCFGRR